MDMIKKAPISRDKLDSIKGKKIINKQEGFLDAIDCLLQGNFACFIDNLDYGFNQLLNTVYLSCSFGEASPDPGDPSRLVSSGSCLSWWGIPGLGVAQKCASIPTTKIVQACKDKCSTLAKPYEASGCDGVTPWCWCK